MPEPLYGHDVLSLVMEQGGSISVADLKAAAQAAHGMAAEYHNCHGDTFDLDGVLAFLASKGKITVADGRIAMGNLPACQH